MHAIQCRLLMVEPQNNLFELENISLENSVSSASHVTNVLITLNFLRIFLQIAAVI
jgi:hypothetical protein